MGKAHVLILPYLSQFVRHSTDIALLEVFHDALSEYRVIVEKFLKKMYDVITSVLYGMSLL